MKPMPNVLTINGGSSSIRFAFFEAAQPVKRLLQGKMERIGSDDASLAIDHGSAGAPTLIKVEAKGRATAIGFLLDWLESQALFETVVGVGHRVVHGMLHADPERVTANLLDELKRMVPFDPEHLPREIELIEAIAQRHREIPQVVCFDTAFHRTMPTVATQLPIPRRYAAKGVQRYGFHGLSYTYLMKELARLRDPAATRGP